MGGTRKGESERKEKDGDGLFGWEMHVYLIRGGLLEKGVVYGVKGPDDPGQAPFVFIRWIFE